jgi:hypothetical protein
VYGAAPGTHAMNPESSASTRRRAKFRSHFFQAPHQECTLVHPLLDAAKGVLHQLASEGVKSQIICERELAMALGHFW